MVNSIPDVKFSIVVGGVKEALDSLKSIQKAADDMYKAIQRAAQQNTKSLRSTQMADAKQAIKIREAETASVIKLDKLRTDAELSMSKKRIQVYKEEVRAKQIINQSSSPNGRSGGFGSIRGVRGIGMMMGASGLPGGSVVQAGVGGFMAGGPAGAAAGLAFAGISEVFMAGVNVFKESALGLASAVTQIGGWKGVVGSIVENASNQRMAMENVNRSINPGMTGGGNLNNTISQSNSSGLGVNDILKAQREWINLTGDITSFNTQFDTLSKISIATGEPMEQVSKTMATLKEQFQGLDEDGLKKIELAAYGLSKFGEIPLDQLIGLAKATGKEGLMGGDQVGNFQLIGGVAEKVSASVGGGRRAATGLSRLFEHMFEGSVPGIGSGTIKDPETSLIRTAVRAKNANWLAASGLGLPEKEVLEQLGRHTTGTSTKEQEDSLRAWIDNVKKQVETQEQLDKEYQDVANTIDFQLKKAFIEISNIIGPSFQESLLNISVYLHNFALALSTEQDEIKEVADKFTKVLFDLIPLAVDFGKILIKLIEWVTDLITPSDKKEDIKLFKAYANESIDETTGLPLTTEERDRRKKLLKDRENSAGIIPSEDLETAGDDFNKLLESINKLVVKHQSTAAAQAQSGQGGSSDPNDPNFIGPPLIGADEKSQFEDYKQTRNINGLTMATVQRFEHAVDKMWEAADKMDSNRSGAPNN